MTIPAFDHRGLLPPFIGADARTPFRAPYAGTPSEIVARFGTTADRKRILSGFLDYRAELHAAGFVSGLQFIDGSFVENVEALQSRSPGDVDVYTLAEIPARYAGNAQDWATSGRAEWQRLTDWQVNKQRYFVDSYGVVLGDVPLSDVINAILYFHGLFGHQRVTMHWKGFAVVSLDPVGDQAARQALQVAP
jgi:hypothetical protein